MQFGFSQQITNAEYFIDTDPGVGNGFPIAITTSGDTVLQNFNVSTNGFALGFHNLWVRTQDNLGRWSIYMDKTFYINDTTSFVPFISNQPQIIAAEYFVDTDPGVGNGIAIPVEPGDTVLKNFNVNVMPYSIGAHYLFVRTMDASGVWSQWASQAFDIQVYPLGGIVSDNFDVTCFGGCDGSATVTPTGGIPTWSFAWYTNTYTAMGIADSTATNLCAGTYHCIITDSNSDADTVDVVISQPASFSAAPNPTDATCGEDNGVAAVTISGGTAPFSYAWVIGDLTATVDSLAGGNVYQLTVTDANGCTANSNVFVNATPAVSLSLTPVNPSCFGMCDGEVSSSITGGTTPIDYYWNNAETSSSLSGLCADTYFLTVTDAAGCIDTATVVLTEPSEIVTTVNTNDSDCGINNGNATVGASGGQSPYAYLWSSGDVATTADSLASGIYTVTITDDNGCINFETVLINDENGPIITVIDFADPSCLGSNDGAIDVTVGGGTAPYGVLWSNGETTEDISGLEQGPYEITVTDAGGCIAIESISISDPQQMSLSFSVFSANCGNADGFVTATVFGGVGPYSYSWSSGGSNTTEAGLAAGIYTLDVTDANSCTVSSLVAMSEAGGPTVSVVSIVETECGFQNGSIDVEATGGTGTYTYFWSNTATTQDVSGVGSGSYEVTVTDQSNCSGVAVAEIPAVVPDIQDLCLVTVDTLAGTNLVVWEKPVVQGGIESYNIYRETSQFGVFQFLANQPYATLSQFTDPVADPMVRSWRYKVSVVDTCGNESAMSSYHKTIHLVLSSFGNDVYLSWDHYEGFAFPSYVVWRYTDQSGWVAAQTLPSNLTSYTDLSPTGTGLDYFIEAVPTSGCTSTNKAQDHNTTRSNRHTIDVPNPDAISEIELNDITISPNPTQGRFEITTAANFSSSWSIEVYGITGKSIMHVKGITDKTYKVDLSESESGVYLVRIQEGDKMLFSKVVKQ